MTLSHLSARQCFSLLLAIGSVTVLGVATNIVAADCPVPVENSTGSNVQSPEQNSKKVFVTHKGKVICVSRNAADAHARHGDAIGGPCQS